MAREVESPTALGSALAHAAGALAEAPDCQAWTVDVAGDGWSNEGIEPEVVYATFPFEKVMVNALVIVTPRNRDRLVGWFEEEVLHGPGSFWILAEGYKDYERAMTAKLLRELELPLVSGWPMAVDAG